MDENPKDIRKTIANFNWVSLIFQTIAALFTVIKICRTRKTCGFSINFLLLYATSLAFKYLDNQSEIQLEIPEGMKLVMKGLILLKIILLLITLFQSVACLCFTEYSDDAADILWIVEAILASLVFAKDNISFYMTVKERWMFGSYLDIAALISELMLIAKTDTVFEPFLSFNIYIFSMLTFDLLNINYYSYEYYRHEFFGNTGLKLMFVKLILWCGCFIRRFRDRVARENIPIELVRTMSESTPAETSLDVPIVRDILGEKYAFNNKHGLMSPN